ncbi:MAG: hypothetical protein GY877_13270 [Hyphomicrobium sp.]|nr:hypothetical protein [Hyphomicrobium sp.]
MTVYGTLLGEDDMAVALVMGEAYRDDDPRRRIAFFTNAAGKFEAEGLAPGEWTLEVATEGEPTNFLLVVPEDAGGASTHRDINTSWAMVT